MVPAVVDELVHALAKGKAGTKMEEGCSFDGWVPSLWISEGTDE